MSDREKLQLLERKLKTIKDKQVYGPALRPHFDDIAEEAWCAGSRDTLGFPMNTFLFSVIFDGGRQSHWVLDRAELANNYKWFKKNIKKVQGHFEIWLEEGNEFINLVRQRAIKEFEPLLDSYKLIIKKFHFEFGRAALPEAPSMVGDGDINKIKNKYKISGNDLVFLLKEPWLSFLAENNFGLLRIALTGQKQLAKSYAALPEKIKKLIKSHQEKYFWIENSYYEHKNLSENEFWKRIKEIVRSKSWREIEKEADELENYERRTKSKKEKLRKKYSISRKDADFLEIFAVMTWWQDARKKTGLYMNYAVGTIMELAARKFKVPFIDLHFMIAPEFIEFLKSGGQYEKGEIKRRQKLFISTNNDKGERIVLSGDKYLKFAEKIVAQNIKTMGNLLKGLAASPGEVKGRVRIILNPKGARFREGEILVAGMTRPEYVPLIKRAAAIVTDEGGVTCHAAVVSRELGIPCIIGTKIATKVLKDGDLVEVDANKGVVRKI
jgi:phosphohistidine swiveling domain-containing protein